MSAPETMPTLDFHNRQRKVRCAWNAVKTASATALPLCLEISGPGDAVLAKLGTVEISLVGDKRIGRIHGTYLNDPCPTDVITFPHGEIFLGAGVIAANARAFGHPVERELTLCVIHGLLHLHGFLDDTNQNATAMEARQEEILRAAARAL